MTQRIIIEMDNSEALARRKPDPPPAQPMPQNPAWVNTWEDAGYTPAPTPPKTRQVRAQAEASRQWLNYGLIIGICLLIVTGFNGCVNMIRADAQSDQLEEILKHKGLLD